MRREGQTRQANSPRRDAEHETRLTLLHMVDGDDAIRPWTIFRGAKSVSMDHSTKISISTALRRRSLSNAKTKCSQTSGCDHLS